MWGHDHRSAVESGERHISRRAFRFDPDHLHRYRYYPHHREPRTRPYHRHPARYHGICYFSSCFIGPGQRCTRSTSSSTVYGQLG